MEAGRGGRPPFNPVCRELGAPPFGEQAGHEWDYFQSRLPGVGGSALRPLDREVHGPLQLSIPFAGSWGLRRPAGCSWLDIGKDFQSRLPGVGGSASGVAP